MICSIFGIFSTGCISGKSDTPLGLHNGKLSKCPKKPNCVSTQASDRKKKMSPLPFHGDIDKSKQILLTILNSIKRSRLVADQFNYIHLEFRSALFGFVDDVEFFFDEQSDAIQFRSASRVGSYDLGVNRKRMSTITDQYLNALN